jgi:hypothetical protein
MKKHVFVALASVTLVGALAACAPAEIGAVDEAPPASSAPDKPKDEKPADEPADTRQDMVVVEKAFGQSTYDPTSWWYVVIVENPNADYVFDGAVLDIEALSADGVILDTGSDFTTLLSGRTAITGTFSQVGANIVTDISLRGPDKGQATKAPASSTGSFTVEGVSATSDSYSTTVSGNVTANFETEQELVEVVSVARNAAGQIIGSEMTFVDRLPVGGTVRFETTYFDVMPADTTYDVFVSL